MDNNWQKIWNKKQIDSNLKSTLEQLVAINGFSSPFGGLDGCEGWIEYIERIAKKLKIAPDDSIFEVGCGGGAFLYPFYQKGNKVAGIDYAPSLVEVALKAMPEAMISVGEAIDIQNQSSQFDIVISNSVLFYFTDYEYAGKVVQYMVKIANKSIGILDVPDLAKKQEDIQRRQSQIGEDEYNQKYQGLEHLYYSKDWFEEVLADLAVKVVIEDQYIRNYGNSDYRFNVFIYKQS